MSGTTEENAVDWAVGAIERAKELTAEVIRLRSDLALARAVLAGWEKRYPCEYGCVMVGSPEEDCSRHGRTPSELWSIIRDAYDERDLREVS